MTKLTTLLILLFLSLPLLAQDQAQLNKQAQERFEKVEREMNQVFQDIAPRLPEPQQARFRQAQKAWLAYLEAESYAQTTPFVGGLKAIEVDYNCRAELTQKRTSILRQWFEALSF